MHQSVSLDLSDHSHASSLRVRFTPCGGCCGVLSRFPLQNWKDPRPQIQGDGGPNFQLSLGEANENHFIQDHSFLLGQLMSSELWMLGDKGYKVPVPRPQHERLLKGQPSSRALCCKRIAVWFFPLLSLTSLIPPKGLILTALSNKPLTGKFLSQSLLPRGPDQSYFQIMKLLKIYFKNMHTPGLRTMLAKAF